MNYDHLDIRNLNRRAVLKGLGVSLALPFLDSWGSIARATTPMDGVGEILTSPPKRYVTILFANGVNTEHWWAKGAGEGMELSKTLSPLAPHKKDILVLNNLEYFGGTSGAHWPQFTNFLSGAKLRQSTLPDAAMSIDQVIAQQVGGQTFLPSMHFSTEPVEAGLRLGVPAIYYSTISWSASNTPIPPEIYPRAAFDRLFDKESLLKDKSVLDLTLSQSKRLRKRLSGQDRAKMDQFLESVRSVERRIERATAEGHVEGWTPTLTEPNMPRPEDGRPHDFATHTDILMDLIVLALQMDKTRVVTYVMDKDVSGQKFDFIDGVSGNGMHGISHHGGKPDVLEDYQQINEWHVKKFAYFLDKMKSVEEDNGTLLDNSMTLFGSNLMDGNIHDGRELPIVLAGGKNCGVETGRVLTYDKPEERDLCNLHLTMAQRMGVNINSFGDSQMPLPGLDG